MGSAPGNERERHEDERDPRTPHPHLPEACVEQRRNRVPANRVAKRRPAEERAIDGRPIRRDADGAAASHRWLRECFEMFQNTGTEINRLGKLATGGLV